MSAIRKSGFDDGGVAEIIAHVEINIFTNYFNKASQTSVDFPEVKLLEVAAI